LTGRKSYLDYATILQKINPKLKIIITGSIVSFGQHRCGDIINKTKDPLACNNDDLVDYYDMDEEKKIKEKWPDLNFYFLDQRYLLCGNNRSFEKCDFIVDGVPIIFDAHHFNDLAVPKLISRLGLNDELEKVRGYVLGNN
jgi:hypothetical protein